MNISKVTLMNLKMEDGPETASIEKVTDDISILKSEKDCPVLLDDETYRPLNLNFVLSKQVFPYGRCCRAVIKESIDKTQKMFFRVKIKERMILDMQCIL